MKSSALMIFLSLLCSSATQADEAATPVPTPGPTTAKHVLHGPKKPVDRKKRILKKFPAKSPNSTPTGQ
jgi:hypothetical protein